MSDNSVEIIIVLLGLVFAGVFTFIIESRKEQNKAALAKAADLAKAAERKGMERALEIVRTHLVDNTLESPGFTWDAIEAAIRAAMEE